MNAKQLVLPADSSVPARLSAIPIPAPFFVDRALALDELDRDRLCCSSLVHIVSKIVVLLFSAMQVLFATRQQVFLAMVVMLGFQSFLTSACKP
jgi:hypothetical protein